MSRSSLGLGSDATDLRIYNPLSGILSSTEVPTKSGL